MFAAEGGVSWWSGKWSPTPKQERRKSTPGSLSSECRVLDMYSPSGTSSFSLVGWTVHIKPANEEMVALVPRCINIDRIDLY